MSSSPGMLYVTMQPKPGLPPSQFHEWYNNEHGPTRLRLPHIFSNGLRYRATDGASPEFLAAYNVTSMAELETETYTSLRANRSPREAETIAKVDVKRFFYDFVSEEHADGFTAIEALTDEQAEGMVTVAVEITLKKTPKAGAQYQKWFIEEHVKLLTKVPGWQRSRLFKTSTLQETNKTIYLALHDYTAQNGLGGAQHAASMDTPWRTRVFDECVADKARRTYELFYVFGPAPRDLASLAKGDDGEEFVAGDERTRTVAGDGAVIASYVTTTDSLSIPYQLEGNSSPGAPMVAFCNSLLTDLHMWDPLIKILKTHRPDLRILRYNTRGRHQIPQPPTPATLTTLISDLTTLLDALRIPKLHTLIGVSMGGATTLNFALCHPSRVDKFIACDFNCASSSANTQAWKDRIATAHEDEGRGMTKLADATVLRWFHPSTSQDKPDVVRWMTDMVAANNVQGFANSCTALWDYDLEPELGTCQVPGMLVVGEADGKGALVKAMDRFRGLVGDKGVELAVVPDAGHLPMCEAPEAFWEAVREFI